MFEKTLTDAKEYFNDVVKPNVQEFLSEPSTFRLAFNAAGSLFHLHEWLFESKKADLEQHFGPSLSSKGDFWGQVEVVVPEAGTFATWRMLRNMFVSLSGLPRA